MITPLYKAKVEILLPFTSAEDPVDGSRQNGQNQADAFVVRSYQMVAEDVGICEQVIESLDLSKHKEFQEKPGFLSSALVKIETFLGLQRDTGAPPVVSDADRRKNFLIDKYRDRLDAKNDTKSLILDLSFQSTDPYLAAAIVNAHAQAFIKEEVRFHRHEAEVRAAWMKTELDAASQEVRDAQMAIQMRQTNFGTSREASAQLAADLKASEMLAGSKKTLYEDFLEKYRTIVAEQRYGGSGIRILSPAIVPAYPAFPRKLLFGAAAGVLSVVLGFFIAAVITMSRRRDTIDHFGGRNGLATIGRLNMPSRWLMAWPGRSGRFARACFWEQVRQIRSGLCLSEESAPMVVMVTSARPGEGKSLLAASLSRSFASSGSRTLLIDLNVRRPSFYAPVKRSSDFATYLRGKSELAISAHASDPSLPLYVLGCSKRGDPVDADALGRRRMRELFQEARKQFDVVIVDTPAVGALSDALFVAGLADEVLLTAVDDRTALSALAETIQTLRQRRVTIRGLVIADRSKPRRSAFRHMYKYAKSERLGAVWPSTERRFAVRWKVGKPAAIAASNVSISPEHQVG